MIEINGVCKSFDELNVLKEINMKLEDGKIYGLIGQSGSGKSTLLRCINGLTDYDKGSIKIDNIEVSELKNEELRRFRQNIGMIFQNYSLLNRLNVYDNIALPMRCWKYHKKVIDKRVNELLDMIQIPDKKYAFPKELSGGQKQRVAIARALTMEPKVLLCDEATSALDPNIAETIMELLAEINKKLGITVVLVTHQLSIVKAYCEKIYLLENGRVAAEGESEEFFGNPSESLYRLMGRQRENICIKGGRNLRIILNEKQTDEKFFAKMALETNGGFSIIRADTGQYCNSCVFYMILHVEDSCYEKVSAWLEKQGIKWRVEEVNLK